MSARVLLRLPLALAPTDDRALVARFAAERDESAFAAIVKRHGAMVYGVCRRAVRDDHHAEDAFQATFLVLAKNPTAAANAASVGAWLFGVARRVGLSAARRLRRIPPTAVPPRSPDPDFDELLAVLDEEVAALPDDCRAAVVACFLREQTQDEAAKHLGWSLSTLRRRLDRGKELLRSRLTRRGATLSALLLTNSLAKAHPPATLLSTTLDTCVSDSAPAGVAALAAGRPPVVWKLAACAAVALGAIAFAAQPPAPPPTPAPAPRVVEPRQWVTLTGQVVLPDRVPMPVLREITRENGLRDAEHCLKNGRVFEESTLVNPVNLGIRNVVVWLRPDSDDPKAVFPKDKIHPALAAAKPRDREVVVNCCQFEPRVTVARAGDTMVYKNNSAVPHNVNHSQTAGDNPNYNVLLARNGTYRAEKPLAATRIGNQFRCNIHPWMIGYAWAFDHPYFAVTDENGRFSIPSVPVGTWRIMMWQEKAGYRDGRAGRLGHKITVADDVDGVAELPRTAHTSEGWGQE